MKNNIKKLLKLGRVLPITKVDDKRQVWVVGYQRKSQASRKAGTVYQLDEPIMVGTLPEEPALKLEQ